jgi:hypothetical protein
VNETVINFDLIEDILRLLLIDSSVKDHNLVAPEGVDISQGSVLVFMPGMGEIRGLIDRLQGSRIFATGRFDIIPLHSSISSQDQRRAFQKSEKGRRKIIVATNIAETSGTYDMREPPSAALYLSLSKLTWIVLSWETSDNS